MWCLESFIEGKIHLFTVDVWNSFHSLPSQMSVQLEQQAEVRKGLLDKFAVKSGVAKLCEMSWVDFKCL